MSDGRYRYPIGVVLFGAIVGVVALDRLLPMPIAGPVAAIALGYLALRESLALFEDRLPVPVRRAALLAGILLLAGPWVLHALDHLLGRPELGALAERLPPILLLSVWPVLSIPLIAARRRGRVESGDLPAVGLAMCGVLAAALPLSLLIDLMLRVPDGETLAVIVVRAAKLNDIGGYVGGTLLGRHRMAPGISPNKTWEGALAGLSLGTLGAVVLLSMFGPFDLGGGMLVFDPSLAVAVAFGLALGLATQAGDLVESLAKRSAGRKDSSTLLPAFGGAFDMVDSLIFAVPLVWVWISFLE